MSVMGEQRTNCETGGHFRYVPILFSNSGMCFKLYVFLPGSWFSPQ